MQNWSEQLLKAVINADRQGGAMVVDQALAEGIIPECIITDVLEPTLVELGKLWGEQSVSLSQGFVAGKIAEDVLLRCLPVEGTESVEPRKGITVIGNIENDFHSLGRRMVTSFLSASGWDVHDLGNDVPAEMFVDKALEVGALVVGVSAMMQTTALGISKLRKLIEARGLRGRLKLAVGGAVFNWRPELVAEVGGDGTAGNAAAVDELFQRLQNEAQAEQTP